MVLVSLQAKNERVVTVGRATVDELGQSLMHGLVQLLELWRDGWDWLLGKWVH